MKQEYDFSAGERGRFFRESARLRLPVSDEKSDWLGLSGPLGAFIVEEARKTLNAYREQPNLITEHANSEQDTVHGGYAHRQLFELVQNSADALLKAPNGRSILIRLTERFLYCADDGTPIDEGGVRGLMFDRMSSKRNTAEIGRFGRGFKSVLGVTDAPEFYSRSGSFRFDKRRAAKRIAEIPGAEGYHPVLRLPEPIDPDRERSMDEELRELMSWATNIVRLPLKTSAHGDLAQQIRDFPPEFLLFVDHVHYLTLEGEERSRNFMLHRQDGELHLDTGEGTTRWRRFSTTHRLSDEARADWPLHDHNDDVLIQWAASLDQTDRAGRFWAFFPTDTASLVAGILNAPWKTNEDRQNLLSGRYNKELIEAAAKMIAEALPQLATNDDPARHLDMLPRRYDASDPEQVDFLRRHLFSNLHGREIVPDQDGNLRAREDLSYPPKELTPGGQIDMAPFERWAKYSGRPSNWLHHTVLRRNQRNRLATIDRLYHPEGEPPRGPSSGAPRAALSEWLEALVEGKEADEAIRASSAAIQTAALIPRWKRTEASLLGEIVLTAVGNWRMPDPERLFLPDDFLPDDPPSGNETADPESRVHPELASDPDTLAALETLGFKPPSPESRFRAVAGDILGSVSREELSGDLHCAFWIASRELTAETANTVIREQKRWQERLRVRTRAGNWQPLHSVLLPGKIVPGDGSRDDDATVDTRFHERDVKLLHDLGVTETAQDGRDLSAEPLYNSFHRACLNLYSKQDNLPHNPRQEYLDFESSKGVGPLEVLTTLSDESNALYTDALLNLAGCYERWTMLHTGTNGLSYPWMPCEAFTIHILRNYGRIRTPGGIVPLADALGPQPKSLEALHTLLVHPMADKIKEAFDLTKPTPEFFGEGEPGPLTDVWPGLKDHLPAHLKECRLVPCERILVVGRSRECVFHAPDIYLVGAVDDDERCKLGLVAGELELDLSSEQIDQIVDRKTPQEVEERRAVIRAWPTDAERLLEAVGEAALRQGLPDSLLAVLESDGATLTGADIAEASIATWHTDALRRYKKALALLDPPSKWAGSARAVEFVRLLGFSAEWAGERNEKRDPFLEVEGPLSLPDLHPYQRTIADNVRDMLRGEHGAGAGRRGMISLPTGSGKTRVAVQAIVEAMRDDDFRGDILWVADRDELCEQAVQSWRQVWSSVGAEAVQLRISRMWAGLDRPQPTNERHVVVATVQTLNAKLSNRPDEYKFLAGFKLVVFDEAHRSIAPTFTSVMEDIGLTRFQRPDEPFLIGLTATPYRGRDEIDIARLVRRYGSERLDSGAFDSDEPEAVVGELQHMSVLAQADHEIIEGETLSLDVMLKQELDKWRALALPWLPQSVEDRIAGSVERTKRIVEAYEKHVHPDWPTLIFATSVEHAQTVAALLNRKKIRSRAVSANTEAATRRRVVEEFRRGEIRALVNYGVFREGFDAPKTRAIIVARPVYSPNLYFQMIGRGLRGPLNGGEERCLILNVRDNIENFERTLAFSELDWLWAPSSSDQGMARRSG